MKNKRLLLFALLLLTSCGGTGGTSVVSSITSSSSNVNETSTSSSSSSESSSAIKDNKVDVILLAGQSNCEGHSFVKYLKEAATDEQKNWYTNGFRNTVIRYSCDSGNNSNANFSPVKEGMGYNPERFGIEVGLAEGLQDKQVNKKVFVIKYAVGGTTLFNDWHSPSSNMGASRCYEGLIQFAYEALNQIESMNYQPVVKALCWMQGETDATLSASYDMYYDMEKAFVKDVFKKMANYAPEEGISFVDGGISDSPSWTYYQEINQAKQKLDSENDNYYYIDTISEQLDYHNEPIGYPDLYHYDATSELKLGKLFADVLVNNEIIK